MHTGLDQRTISQALNGKGRIAPATRERILQAAHELGYRPNLSAQAIRGGGENRIGLLLGLSSRLSNLPHMRLQGMQVAALEEGVSLSICTFPDKAFANEQEQGRFLGNFGVDGMLVNFEQDTPQELLKILRHFNIPVIALNSRFKDDCVYHDNPGIARQAVETLAGAGFSQILYVDYGPRLVVEKERTFYNEHYSAAERRNGVLEAGKMLRVSVESATIDEKNIIVSYVQQHKNDGIRPAIICNTELAAQRVMAELCVNTCHLPEDALIVYFGRSSFCDDTLDRMMRVLYLPEFMMGKEAVRLLMQRVRKGGSVPGVGVSCSEDDLRKIITQESYLRPQQHEHFRFHEEALQ